MRSNGMNPSRKAALATAVIFLVGAAAGMAADRVWLGLWPPRAEAASLTPEGLVRALDLDSTQRARVDAVLDSLQVEMTGAVTAGPDSLRSVARRGRQRLEDALPPDRRAPFRQWMQAHHARMMQYMGRGMMGPDSGAGPPMTPGGRMGPGMMRPDGGMGPGMMGPDSGRGTGMMGPRGRGRGMR
ncbi:MAG TPA: hypothetical protein VE646_11565 [Actinomycetota bacterium]|nr:hypothetical protein [Actinomycetota bacterium]